MESEEGACDAAGSILDVRGSIKQARLHDRDSLTLHVNRVEVRANRSAFAVILGDGSVVTWGNGGDSRAVQDQLNNVRQIQASNHAFVAILGDGSVVTWGDPHSGGDSRAVQDQLNNVRQIRASDYAFAAILGDGSVVTWGDPHCAGSAEACASDPSHWPCNCCHSWRRIGRDVG